MGALWLSQSCSTFSARSIVGQQVSVHAARSIWLRLEAAVPSMEPAAFLEQSDEQLRAVGLSGAKMKYGTPVTSLKALPKSDRQQKIREYMDANQQVKDELAAIRQPVIDFNNRCGVAD